MRVKHQKCFAHLDAKIGRDALCDIDRNIGLACPAVIRRPNRANSWKRKFIGDKRIVG